MSTDWMNAPSFVKVKSEDETSHQGNFTNFLVVQNYMGHAAFNPFLSSTFS